MSSCLAEFCANWTGHGCICALDDLEPNPVEHNSGCACDNCEVTDPDGPSW